MNLLRRCLAASFALAVIIAQPAWVAAQFDQAGMPRTFENVVSKVEAKFEPATAKRGETITWKLTVELAPGWHTYPVNRLPKDGKFQQYTEIKFPSSPDVYFVGRVTDPSYRTEKQEVIGEVRVVEGTAVWERPVVVSPKATPGRKTITVPFQLLVCDEKGCLPPRSVKVNAPLTISDAAPVAVDAKYQAEIDNGSAPSVSRPTEVDPGADGSGDYQARLKSQVLEHLTPQQVEHTDLLSFLLAGVFWGAVSLVTPCVFPMIPITVSFFLKQSEKEHHRPITMAMVYCGTIVVVLTIAAVLLLSFFRLLIIHPLMNFGLGLLFVVFALSLFGMYDIELPSGLAQWTSAKQGRGGLIGTMFMALTFTIVSFACVAPFLGGFGGTAATSQVTWPERVLGGLAFSVTFAAPFFVLALFPTLLRKLPKSGSWLNSVKVVMGFLELAAALKFFRAGELIMSARPAFFTYDLVLGMYVALCLLCGLYLLNVYRLPHDTPAESLSVPRLLFSLAFLSLAFYFVPALFRVDAAGDKQRPGGIVYAWVDSFLLPEPREGKSDLAWSGDLIAAVENARSHYQRTGRRKLVFIDFTGKS